MKVSELIERLQKAPDAEVYIAGHMGEPEAANTVLFADGINNDGGLAFMELGDALGEKAILICYEDID